MKDKAINLDKSKVTKLYGLGYTQKEIGEILGVSRGVVFRFMKKNKINGLRVYFLPTTVDINNIDQIKAIIRREVQN